MKKKEKLKEIREKDSKSLFKELEKLNNKLAQFRVENSLKKLKNYRLIQATKKEIAWIWTVLGEKIVAIHDESKGKS